MRFVSLAVVCALFVTGCIGQSSSKTFTKVGTSNPDASVGKQPKADSLTNSPAAEPAVKASAAGLPITPENTKIEWLGAKPDGKHVGGFKQFSGAIEDIKPGLEGSKIAVDIDCESIYSDVPKLTAHLKTADFFDVRTHPKAKFNSTAIKAEKSGDSTHTITGDLTLHGVTKSISFPAKISQTDKGVSIDSKFTINRKDFAMSYGEGKINNDVTITVSIKSEK